MRSRSRIALVAVTVLWAATTLLAATSIISMNRWVGLSRIGPAHNLSAPGAYEPHAGLVADRDRLRKALHQSVGHLRDEKLVLAILEWTMNQIPKVEDQYSPSSWTMVEQGREGRGQLCTGMSHIFRDALLAHGVPARKVILQRNLFDKYSSHVTVEVWVEGRWRIYDPTFHVTMRAGGERVGIQEVRDWLLRRKGKPIEVEFLGEVKYPARVETYPVRYEVLFNNAFVEFRQKYPELLQKLADMGVWLGPRHVNAYPAEDKDVSIGAQDAYRFLFVWVVFVLPPLSLVLFLCMMLLWLINRRQHKVQPDTDNPGAGIQSAR